MSHRYAITTNEGLNEKRFPMTGRLSPIGSASSEIEYDRSVNENNALLEEHERLNASLSALTHHVAHVQFRLQQVISAPTAEDRESLLLELNQFASNGIPDIICQTSIHTQIIEAEKSREKELIQELKQKLDELEHYAAASGSLDGVPTSVTMENQRVLIDQLRQKLDLQLDENVVSKLSTEELKKLVDHAIYQLTNPAKLKENLILQMRTQINDLETFVEFLKADSSNVSIHSKPIERSFQTSRVEHNSSSFFQSIKKFFVLTQLYTLLVLSCGTRAIQKTSNPAISQGKKDLVSKNHFGDLRAQLEIAIDKVLQTVHSNTNEINTMNDIEEENRYLTGIVSSIRHDLAPALRALLEHGLYEGKYSRTSSVWTCFAGPYPTNNQSVHIWLLFLKYYELKQGSAFANSPARKLSQSFSLNIIGGKPITIKQYLLSGIDTIVKLHEKHTKKMDSCFKSFLCYALNEKKLVPFLRLVLTTEAIIEKYYHSWSYVKRTGFNDALHSLNRLTSIDFHLPIDISVRRFISNQDLIE